jgi:alanine or glycine:cation symporter, AGCS family
MQEQILSVLNEISGFIWGPPLLILLVGTGVYLTFLLRGIQFRTLFHSLWLALVKRKEDGNDPGDITHFQALMTALAATVGTGNIAGVATAIAIGGPGALFWMWITGLFGMATKYAEAVLAVKYRVVDEKGEMSGGPMYYISRGMNMKWLGVLFAIFASIAAFGIGNMVQSNSVADAVQHSFNIPPWATGLGLTVATALVILGGIKSIGKVTQVLVPAMVFFYMLAAMFVVIMHIEEIPTVIALILTEAFSPTAAAAAKTKHPVTQALVSMTQTFIDTIVVCSFTGFAILVSEVWTSGANGVPLTSMAFKTALPGEWGGYIVSLGIILFAYSTILGWSYYGEKSLEFLLGKRSVIPYRVLFVLAVFLGAVAQLDLVWTFADIMNGLMAIPNLIALLGLGGIVAAETKNYFKEKDKFL